MCSRTADFLIIGGGIIGISLALEARRRHPDARVVVIDKERQQGWHASGRNSGVLHAGFYYSADSLKARFAREGNRRLTRYCLERGLSINRCGKLVVAADSTELPALSELARRGAVNGVELQLVDASEAREIEPRAQTFERALFSPTTASVDPLQVLGSLYRDAMEAGVAIMMGCAYIERKGALVRTSGGQLRAGYVINTAGLHADRIARDFGFGESYAIIPFKGLYLYSDEPAGALRANVYPVPDLRNPFLGVHFTLTATGKIKIGPTAIPALWREHYRGLSRFNLGDFVEVALRESSMLLRNDFGFRRLAVEEVAKYSKPRLVALARRLVPSVRGARHWSWGAPGIRAQLYDKKARRLEMDFRFEGDDRSFHVLNAVSPAFTCALPFSEFLFERVDALLARRSTNTSVPDRVPSCSQPAPA